MRRLCAVLGVHPSGYYAWKVQPVSARGVQDKRVGALIEQCWEDSGRIYGYRKISSDLNERYGRAVWQAPRGPLDAPSWLAITHRIRPSSRRPRYSSQRCCPESSTTPIPGRCPQPGLGDRHHLHPNARRLALSCRRIGSVLAADRGLVHERSDDPRTCHQRIAGCGLAS